MSATIDFAMLNHKILSTRRQYGDSPLLEGEIAADPFIQFGCWLEEALNTVELDPCAMVLSTIDQSGFPDSRVVLLLELRESKFVFYTSYDGAKASQIDANNKAALNFYWPHFSRQVRIQGAVIKNTRAESQAYFSSRDRGGQLAVYGARQSARLKDRETLVKLYQEAEARFKDNNTLVCPDHWGGYEFSAVKYEFFQGRNSRLHDRIVYEIIDGKWEYYRLAP